MGCTVRRSEIGTLQPIVKVAIAAALLLIASLASAADPIAVIYDADAFAANTYLGALHLQFTFERRGLTVFVDGLNIHGEQPSKFADVAQAVSNLAGPSGSRIEEAWIQQTMLNDRLSVLVGRYDLSTEFYRTQSAGLFFNSSFGTGPELSQNNPSIYPSTSLGGRVAYRPAQSVLLRAATFNGMSIGEAAYLYRPSTRGESRRHRFRLGRLAGLPPYTAKIAIGAWRFSDGRSGMYVTGDRRISRRIAAFGQLGVDRARGDRFARYTGLGIVVSARKNDEVGLALASARDRNSHSETALECTYLAPITSHLAIQPDLQYVIHPNTTRTTKNALVGILRFEIAF